MNELIKFLLKHYQRLVLDFATVGGIMFTACQWKKTDDPVYFGAFMLLLVMFWLMKIFDTLCVTANKK